MCHVSCLIKHSKRERAKVTEQNFNVSLREEWAKKGSLTDCTAKLWIWSAPLVHRAELLISWMDCSIHSYNIHITHLNFTCINDMLFKIFWNRNTHGPHSLDCTTSSIGLHLWVLLLFIYRRRKTPKCLSHLCSSDIYIFFFTKQPLK